MLLPERFLPFSGCYTLRGPVRSARDLVLRTRFVGGFLLLAWPVFLFLVRGDGWIPAAVRHNIGFIVGLWESDAARAVVVSHVGILVQHSWPQMLYVTALLLVAGVAYEAREGTLRTFLVFYGSTLCGVALLTVVVLLAPVPAVSPLSERAVSVSWSGASVGCFGLVGALVATARSPGPWLAALLLFELTVELNYVPVLALAMHGVAFAFGFVVSRLAHMQDAPAASMPRGSHDP